MTASKHGALIGVDLGGTKVAAGRINGNVPDAVLKKFIPADSDNPQDIIDVIIEVIAELFNENILGIGVGIPSLINRDEGIVNDVQNIPSWKEVHLKAILEAHFNVPVFLDNDANCFALGEARYGKGRTESDFVGLTLGTGMGGGIIKNGFLLPDAHCGSGEFGNIPYLDATYEDYCSGKFFTGKYGKKGEEMAQAASQGDSVALKAFEEFGRHLGNAIKTIKLAVDPRKVIIGGSVAEARRLFEQSMLRSIAEFPYKQGLKHFEVLFSEEKNIAVLGAASLYLDRNKQQSMAKTTVN
jgi:glucokinase